MRVKPLRREDVTRIFVVRSMTPPSQDLTAADLSRIHRLRGYSKIAVHFVIRRNGDEEDGRPLTERAAMSEDNSDCIQVCLIGGVDEQGNPCLNFTRAQQRSLCAMRDALGLPLVGDHIN